MCGVLCVCLCVFVCVFVCVLCGVGVGLVMFGAPGTAFPSPGPKFPWTALPWTAQNFAFFSLSRRKIRSFLPSLGVFSWNFGGVFEDQSSKRLRGRRRQPENSKRAHLRAPALQTPPKFNEKKRTNFAAGEGKDAKFWAPHPSAHPSAPTL